MFKRGFRIFYSYYRLPTKVIWAVPLSILIVSIIQLSIASYNYLWTGFFNIKNAVFVVSVLTYLLSVLVLWGIISFETL